MTGARQWIYSHTQVNHPETRDTAHDHLLHGRTETQIKLLEEEIISSTSKAMTEEPKRVLRRHAGLLWIQCTIG